MSSMDLEIASGHGECPVCFDLLCQEGASVMLDRNPRTIAQVLSTTKPKRICRHFICNKCARLMVRKKLCPVCRQSYRSTQSLPDPLTDSDKWFAAVDKDQDGNIDQQELLDALKAVFPVDPEDLERSVLENWHNWDVDGNQKIDAQEFRDGLAPFLSHSLTNLRLLLEPETPDLRTAPTEWFSRWDEDGSGALERVEVVRAVIKSVPGRRGTDDEELMNTFAAIWIVVDPDNDGHITKEEFMMPGGLRDTVLANFFSGLV